ncbi:salicylate synthase [Streptomyces sp. NPDC050485]|uniref:salicylate synthase n=1 Tax=Streptomyces sp. NPDC050485 TaxID=3365617 RepID=UPI0037900DD7
MSGTREHVHYRETAVGGPFDPLAVVSAVVGSGALADYVVYERDRRWFVAGDPVGEVIVDARQVRSTLGGEFAEPWSGSPWRAVREALYRAPLKEWRAYGWASFELAGPDAEASPDVLAHLMIPGVELEISEERLLIRSLDDAAVDPIRSAVGTGTPAFDGEPKSVDVRTLDGRYLAGVAHAVEQIRSGRLQKVVLSRCVDVPFDVDMRATYVAGRKANTPARSFLLDLGGWQVTGFSPETVVEVAASGAVSTQPLAGTRARTGDPVADLALRAELQTDPKEVFEHATSVKLAFDELETVGRQGSTRVSEFLAVKERGSVQHLGSRVDTTLAEPYTAWDALAAVFPAITASGIPKSPAYELITHLESGPRGLYAGAVLMAGSGGELDAALVLRAVYQRTGRAWLRAGAGVVAASTPVREHEETCEKLSSVAPFVVPAAAASPTRETGESRRGETPDLVQRVGSNDQGDDGPNG